MYKGQEKALYLVQWTEEGEKKSDQKEQEEKSLDDNKHLVSINFMLSGCLADLALHIITDSKYSAPSGEITPPPPEFPAH